MYYTKPSFVPNKKTIIALVVFITMLIAFPSTGWMQNISYTIQDEQTELSAQNYPSFYGDHMVWSEIIDKKTQIMYRNIKTGEVKQLTTGDISRNKYSPVVSTDVFL